MGGDREEDPPTPPVKNSIFLTVCIVKLPKTCLASLANYRYPSNAQPPLKKSGSAHLIFG